MATCPACGSSRIRSGYHSAPLPLRLAGVRELLCDNCNLQFRAFALRAPRRHKSRAAAAGVGKLTPTPVLESVQLRSPEASQHISAEVNPGGPSFQQNVQRPPAAASPAKYDEVEPEITPVMLLASEFNEQESIAEPEHETTATKHRTRRSSSAARPCPKCNSTDTHRRHRRTWERIVFSFSSIRPYRCEDCGASFYSRRSAR